MNWIDQIEMENKTTTTTTKWENKRIISHKKSVATLALLENCVKVLPMLQFIDCVSLRHTKFRTLYACACVRVFVVLFLQFSMVYISSDIFIHIFFSLFKKKLYVQFTVEKLLSKSTANHMCIHFTNFIVVVFFW